MVPSFPVTNLGLREAVFSGRRTRDVYGIPSFVVDEEGQTGSWLIFHGGIWRAQGAFTSPDPSVINVRTHDNGYQCESCDDGFGAIRELHDCVGAAMLWNPCSRLFDQVWSRLNSCLPNRWRCMFNAALFGATQSSVDEGALARVGDG